MAVIGDESDGAGDCHEVICAGWGELWGEWTEWGWRNEEGKGDNGTDEPPFLNVPVYKGACQWCQWANLWRNVTILINQSDSEDNVVKLSVHVVYISQCSMLSWLRPQDVIRLRAAISDVYVNDVVQRRTTSVALRIANWRQNDQRADMSQWWHATHVISVLFTHAQCRRRHLRLREEMCLDFRPPPPLRPLNKC